MRWGLAIAAAAVALGVIAAGASAVILRAGDLIVNVEGAVTPTKLSPTAPSPISFKVSAGLQTAGGGPLPALQTFSFDADRQGSFFTGGLPTCAPSRLRSADPAEAMKLCGNALVGTGTTSALLSFPEQTPYVVSAPLLMFNGGSSGRGSLLVMLVYAQTPVPTTFVVLGVVTKTAGVYGTNTLVKIPTIAGGYGSLKGFEVRIHRTWSYRGKKRSFLVAHCGTGRFLAHAEFAFANGAQFSGTLVKQCTPKH